MLDSLSRFKIFLAIIFGVLLFTLAFVSGIDSLELLLIDIISHCYYKLAIFYSVGCYQVCKERSSFRMEFGMSFSIHYVNCLIISIIMFLNLLRILLSDKLLFGTHFNYLKLETVGSFRRNSCFSWMVNLFRPKSSIFLKSRVYHMLSASWTTLRTTTASS